jgi:hypothetical protein
MIKFPRRVGSKQEAEEGTLKALVQMIYDLREKAVTCPVPPPATATLD